MDATNRESAGGFDLFRRLRDSALPTAAENPWPLGPIGRRDLLKLLGASAALALGGTGCHRKPDRQIVSRPTGPEYQPPGKALFYSSTWTEGPCPYGLMIKTVDGRPVKIEGNPDHPMNAGAASAAMQASILSLYEPDRLRAPRCAGVEHPWADADEQVVDALRRAASVALVTRATLGPSERALAARFLALCRKGVHFVHESADDRPRRSAWRKLYGQDGEVRPLFDRAAVVLSLDSDFLGTDGAVLENIRGFAAARTLPERGGGAGAAAAAATGPIRLYVAEGAASLTGANADHRLRVRPARMAAFAAAVRAAVAGEAGPLAALAVQEHLDGAAANALARDLRAAAGRALVVAGPHLPECVHATVALLNADLAAPGKTLAWNPAPAALPVTPPGEVEAALAAGVDVLLLLGVNPVYDWPGRRPFRELMSAARLTVGHGASLDETLSECAIALPTSHNLESWNDAAPRPGIETLCQPVIAPLFSTRSEAESLLRWAQALAPADDPLRQVADWHGYVSARWIARLAPGAAADADGARERSRAWEEALRKGGTFRTEDTSFPPLAQDAARDLARAAASAAAGDFDLVLLPHPALHDGRFAMNGWLQELPHPVSKLVWDNAAALSPATAARLDVKEGDLVTVTVGAAAVTLPALLQPGMADGVVATTLGAGRTQAGRVGTGRGTNVAPLLGREDAAAPRCAFRAQVRKAGGHYRLVRTQQEFSAHDRPIVLDGTLDEYQRDPDFIRRQRPHVPDAQVYEPVDYSKGHKWAMAIDLGSCVGCAACVTACQAENNIPIVGKDNCAVGRAMHWLRIDRYEEGDPANPLVHHQPMLCQQCDNAPCESVCPVNATTHSPEGLNEMSYNRCVGTRYCSNNCPFKVRRFNFSRYHEAQFTDPVQELVFNPQVTVRGVGVMEKCNFCVQRINEVKYQATNRGEKVRDGAIRTACQQTCPAQAIVFGDANDPDGRVAKLRASGRAFFVLEELNVKPNVAYLARVRNPEPSAAPARKEKHG